MLFFHTQANTLSWKKNCLEITPIVYTYTRNSYTQAPPAIKMKKRKRLISVMTIGKKEEKYFAPRIQTWDLWNSRWGPYNCTTMYMVSGHHSNTFSSVSPNQKRQSKFYKYFSHSTCSYKNFPLMWSIAPVSQEIWSLGNCRGDNFLGRIVSPRPYFLGYIVVV